jgi:aminoglycoside phosphotransferase (APT) family kinase protein
MSKPATDQELAAAKVGVAVSRDLGETARTLETWLAARLPNAERIEISGLEQPGGGGGSSETFFLVLAVTEAGHRTSQDMVLRIDPTSFRLFLRRNFDEQYHLLDWLARETKIPIPPVRFYEPDPAILGAPFWIMERIVGEVPPDNPSYNAGGFVFDASEAERRELWRAGMEILGELGRIDPGRLPRIVDLKAGQSGLGENLEHWTASMSWACDGRPPEFLARVNAWLHANRPARGDTGLSWGDARIGNMIFRGGACAGVLDWETITLAGPQLDLAHWLLMDDYSSACLGLERLPGLGTRAETIALWEELTGRKADQLGWHEVLATFRLSVVMERYARLWVEAGRHDLKDAQGDTLMMRHLRQVFARIAQ